MTEYVYPTSDAVSFSWEGAPEYTTPDSALVGFTWEGVEYRISGTVKDKNGALCERRVIAIMESTGSCAASVLSDSVTGAFEIVGLANSPHTLVFIGESDRNALVYAGVMPEAVL